MPTYAYECPNCQTRIEKFRRVAEHSDCPECLCGSEMRQVITGVRQFVGTDDFDYVNVIDGKRVQGKKQHREFLKRNNCVDYEHTGEW